MKAKTTERRKTAFNQAGWTLLNFGDMKARVNNLNAEKKETALFN